MGGRGGIGRRSGLKIRFPKEVRVRVPPSAPIFRNQQMSGGHLPGKFPSAPVISSEMAHFTSGKSRTDKQRAGAPPHPDASVADSRRTGGRWPLIRTPALCAFIAAAMSLSACGIGTDDGAPRVTAIGNLHRNIARTGAPWSMADRLYADAIGQGLVTLAGDGQVESGLAERWTVIDDGRSYIFRLRDAHWVDGRTVTAGDVAAMLRQRIGSLGDASPLDATHIRSIRAMTSRVIEVQLTRPIPDFLERLAQSDLYLMRAGGWGPMRARWNGASISLRRDDDMRPGTAAEEAEAPSEQLQFWGSPSSVRAIAQFLDGDVDAVIGGRFEAWPYVEAANVSDSALAIDPVQGLFGLRATPDDRDSPTADATVRHAIDMAIDRTQIARGIAVPAWQPRITLRPAGPLGVEPPLPEWQSLNGAERRTRARALLRQWAERHGGAADAVPLRIALPDGPGARRLFAWLRADLQSVGFRPALVPLSASADLRLVDEVAPGNDAAWYFDRLRCRAPMTCDALNTRVAAFGEAADETARRAALTDLDAAMRQHAGFIPFGNPVRWNLRTPRLANFAINARGWHGLYRLTEPPH